MAISTSIRKSAGVVGRSRPGLAGYAGKVVLLGKGAPRKARPARAFPVSGTSQLCEADERYAALEAGFNAFSPNPDWFEKAEELEREVLDARMSVQFDEN